MYHPAEDSFILSESIKKYLEKKGKSFKILDMGTGSGIQAETCKSLGFNNILAADIDSASLEYVKNKVKVKTIKSNLFSKIKNKFDLILFNPPYLPEHEHDKEKDTSGGKKGDETIIKFLNQAKSHLTKDGEILLLSSSLTPNKEINKIIKKYYKKKKLSEKKLFFEILEVWKIQRKNIKR